MGIFDKARDLASQHSDKLRQGVERAGDEIDKRTGGKHAGHVDKGQDALNRLIDKNGGSGPGDNRPDRDQGPVRGQGIDGTPGRPTPPPA